MLYLPRTLQSHVAVSAGYLMQREFLLNAARVAAVCLGSLGSLGRCQDHTVACGGMTRVGCPKGVDYEHLMRSKARVPGEASPSARPRMAETGCKAG